MRSAKTDQLLTNSEALMVLHGFLQMLMSPHLDQLSIPTFQKNTIYLSYLHSLVCKKVKVACDDTVTTTHNKSQFSTSIITLSNQIITHYDQ